MMLSRHLAREIFPSPRDFAMMLRLSQSSSVDVLGKPYSQNVLALLLAPLAR